MEDDHPAITSLHRATYAMILFAIPHKGLVIDDIQQMRAVAEIPGRDDPKMNIFQLVYERWCDPRNGRWLMVLDNADDGEIFFSGSESHERGPLVGFLPEAAHGSILITSRNGLAARNLVGSNGHVIEVRQ